MRAAGRVASINVSLGGVPKRPVSSARVTKAGVIGDFQLDRRFHGGPERAVSLFSLEQIEALQLEGHPIAAGTTGENVTVAGLDWTLVMPGVTLGVGEAAVEITSFAAPCRTIRHSFASEEFKRLSEKLHPGFSRVYARVLREGTITVGDFVSLL